MKRKIFDETRRRRHGEVERGGDGAIRAWNKKRGKFMQNSKKHKHKYLKQNK